MSGSREPIYRDRSRRVEERITDLMSRMTLEEKVAQMSRPGCNLVAGLNLLLLPFRASENKRLGIPPFVTIGSSRGSNIRGTAFPVSISRGASWNPDLEFQVHKAIGREAAAFGANVLLSPTINLLRHPGWGRSQETYGEDRFLMGEMAVSAIRGAQRHVMAQVKHFALNSIEENRFRVSADADERTLREIYLYAFRKATQQANVATVMASYNRVNGRWASENHHLLRTILKGEWGFDGPVMSDWMHGVNSTVSAARSGLDVEMPVSRHFGDKLTVAVRDGLVDESIINEAVTRILRRKFEWGLFDKKRRRNRAVIRCHAHRHLALEAAREGLVLLKNDRDLLPLSPGIPNLVILGKSAKHACLGDMGSSQIHDRSAVSVLEGIRRASGTTRVTYYGGRNRRRIAKLAAQADSVVIVSTLGPFREGEWIPEYSWTGLGGDRDSLALPDADLEILHAAAAANKRVILVIQGGGAVATADWKRQVQAALMAWYPGVEGGTAVGESLFGLCEPGGRLPVTFPKHDAQLYSLGKHNDHVTYEYLQGYRWFDAQDLVPGFAFGHGLGYTRFRYQNLKLSVDHKRGFVVAGLDITNIGERPGAEVVQLYVGYPGTAIQRAPRDLRGFRKARLLPGETRHIIIKVPFRELAWYDPRAGEWRLEPIDYRIDIGSSSRDIKLTGQVRLHAKQSMNQLLSASSSSSTRSTSLT
jgi:beta-glucosidase